MNLNTDKIEILKSKIRDVKDFPKPGIVFKDITTMLKCSDSFKLSIDLLSNEIKKYQPTHIIGIESRGFIFASAIANNLNTGFIPIRKPGKLPCQTIKEEYQLEYSKDSIEIHQDALSENDTVVIVDDVLATGGTISAAIKLTKKLKAKCLAVAFLIELEFLGGRQKIEKSIDIISILNY